MGKDAGVSIMGSLPAEAAGCGALAVEWISGMKPMGEFEEISEAKPGDILFFADWAGRRISVGIFICENRVATCAELRGRRVMMMRVSDLGKQGYEFAGGVHLGR